MFFFLFALLGVDVPLGAGFQLELRLFWLVLTVGSLLFLMTLAMNLLGFWVVRRWRQTY